MRIQRCKGTRDLSPEEMVRFRLIEEVFQKCCLNWGYREVKTPTIEYLHLFTSAGTLTPSMLGKVYSFLDWDGWSGERVVLRPDGTIPIARLYIDTAGKEDLSRLFYVTNTFIFEETGRRMRERWQCGTELIGVGSPRADAELISLALEVLEKLKLGGVKLRLSHAGLIQLLLVKLGLSPEEQSRIFDQILDGNGEVLARIKSEKPELENILFPLLSLKGRSSGFLKNLKALSVQNLPEIGPCLDNLIDIVDVLEALGDKYQIDIASGAGFEYYTGVIFQFFIGQEKIGGGGRYDALIPAMSGGNVPASGFALYIDRLMNSIKPETLVGPPTPRILVTAEQKMLKEAFDTAHLLRESGYVVEIGLGDREPPGLRWTLDIRSQGPGFILWDKARCAKIEVRSIEEVITCLEDRNARKDSLA